MKNTYIIYDSFHKKNTEKVLLAIKEHYPDVNLIKAKDFDKANIEDAELVGIASGIYYGAFSKRMKPVMEKVFESKADNIFYMYTAGIRNQKYEMILQNKTEEAKKKFLGIWFCKGHDTFGPFKLIGGLNKNRPNQEDIQSALKFFENLI